MFKQTLQQKLGLKINPLQVQLIRLLELPTSQLEQRIKEELEQNPLLEEGEEQMEVSVEGQEQAEEQDEFAEFAGEELGEQESSEEQFSLDDYMDSDDIPEYRYRDPNSQRENESRDFIFSEGASFRESLLNQLGTRALSEQDHRIAEYIIGNIDDDGYLRRDVESIVDDLAFGVGLEVSEEKILELLKIIQDFEPAGVGARDLRECLLLQVIRKMSESRENSLLEYAKVILEEYFEEFSRKHYEKITRKLRLDEGVLKQVVEMILKLNPKPGGTSEVSTYQNVEKIIPDFSLDLVDGELQLNLNSGDIPELRINKSYLNLLEQYQTKGTNRDKKDVVSFIKYKLNSAKSFIDAIHQRNNTLMLTMTAIVQFQKQFFLTGDSRYLRPMILKDIADVTGLDVSTISRVSNSKYIQTWFGIYALKDFFSNSMQTVSGEEISTEELKNVLRALVDEENKRKPLTDDEIVLQMEKRGYQLARRTVAKYRQMLGIPVARLRREI